MANSQKSHVVTFLLTKLHCNDGIASYIEMLGKLLRIRGWRCTLVAGQVHMPGASMARYQRLRELMDVWTVEPRLVASGVGRLSAGITQVKILTAVAREHCTYVFHLNGRALGPACWVQKRLTGVSYVNTMQLGLTPAEYPGVLSRLVLGRVLGDRYIAISNETAHQAHKQLGIPMNRIRLIHHGSEARFRPPSLAERQAARKMLEVSPQQFICVVVARLAPVKRHDVVIKAIKQLRSEGRDVIAAFVGEGDVSHVESIKALVSEQGVGECIRFLGHVDPVPVLWAGDVKVLASDLEGFPIVIPEAMACGLVTLRTPCEGATDQIVDGVNGFIFPNGDWLALSKKLAWLQDHPAEREQIGQAAVQFATERFSAEGMVEKTIAVYREAAGDSVRSPSVISCN